MWRIQSNPSSLILWQHKTLWERLIKWTFSLLTVSHWVREMAGSVLARTKGKPHCLLTAVSLSGDSSAFQPLYWLTGRQMFQRETLLATRVDLMYFLLSWHIECKCNSYLNSLNWARQQNAVNAHVNISLLVIRQVAVEPLAVLFRMNLMNSRLKVKRKMAVI